MSKNEKPAEVGGIDGENLQSYINRIERLEQDKAEISADIREVFAEAKGTGFDPKIMREVLKIRKMEQHELDEKESMVHIYRQALGMR